MDVSSLNIQHSLNLHARVYNIDAKVRIYHKDLLIVDKCFANTTESGEGAVFKGIVGLATGSFTY